MTTWSLDPYRRLSLSECHWRMCRRFMARYQHRFPEEQTVALAQIFANTQLLIQGDADKTMELVLDLVKDGEPPRDTGTSIRVKQEKETVENGVVKIEIELDSSSMESIVKREPEEDVKPIKRALKRELKEEISEVDDEPKLKALKSSETVEDTNQAGSLEDLPEEAVACASSTDSSKNKQPKHESHSEIMSELTHFKPALDIMTIEDVYRNLVIFDNDFQQTCNEFNKLGSAFLMDSCFQQQRGGQYRGRVCARQFILAEKWADSFKGAISKAKVEFFRKMPSFCYQIVLKKPSHLPENQVARLEDPATNIKYYKKMIKKLKKESIKQDLVFSAEFSKQEQDDLRSVAWKLGLSTLIVGENRQLKIVGQPIPALAIVERIVVHKDPALCELYEVIPPRKDDDRT